MFLVQLFSRKPFYQTVSFYSNFEEERLQRKVSTLAWFCLFDETRFSKLKIGSSDFGGVQEGVQFLDDF